MSPSGSSHDTTPPDVLTRIRTGDAIQALIGATALSNGLVFLAALVRELAHALNVPYAFVGEYTDGSNRQVRSLAFWTRDKFADAGVYDMNLAGTACNIAIGDVE